MKINIPDSVDLDDNEARLLVAAGLFEKGKLSLGQAAEMAGISKMAFTDILAFHGISVFKQDAESLIRDAENAKKRIY